jgi:peptide-methionine (S)-S-oxide reductase
MFGAGCFWGVEIAFGNLDGVASTAVGYSGGTVDEPSYEQVCSGGTGHVEVVKVDFDPTVVSYNDLLDLFWESHDPTQVDRQGPDIGTQYRSVIFYFDEEQRDQAEHSKATLDASGSLNKPVATRIEPAATFWMAEDYHQRYLEKRGLASCRVPGAS